MWVEPFSSVKGPLNKSWTIDVIIIVIIIVITTIIIIKYSFIEKPQDVTTASGLQKILS